MIERNKIPCLLMFMLFAYFSASGQTGNTPAAFNVVDLYPSGLNTVGTKYADLDNDGRIDAIVLAGSHTNPSPGLNILYGNNSAGFDPMIRLPSFVLGQTLAIGDLNEDNLPDIVIATFYGNYTAVFFNQGNRQFAAPVFTQPPDLPNPGFPDAEFFGLEIADFNGDGRNDVVALQDQVNQRLRFFNVNSNGALTGYLTLDQLETNTSYERVITVGDINGDSRADVVVGGGGPFGVRNISFVFGQPPGVPLSITYGFGVEDKTTSIEVSDIDNDNDKDLVVSFIDTTTPTRHSIQIFKNSGNQFEPQPKMFLEYPFEPVDITVGDFNSDGIKDIASLISGVMARIAYGDANGNYVNEIYYALPNSAFLDSADLNRDGKPDLVSSSTNGINTDIINYNGESINNLGVLYNLGNSRGFKGATVLPWGPNLAAAADFNNDGFSDIAAAWGTEFNAASTIDILRSDGRGNLIENTFTHNTPPGLVLIKTGDFNGDGSPDVISANSNARALNIYLGNGNGSLNTPPVSTSITLAVKTLVVFDINNDGKDDIFAAGENSPNSTSLGYALLSNGAGGVTIAPGSPVLLPTYVPFELRAADFNNDSKKDLIINTNSDNFLWLGDGQGRFSQSTISVPTMRRIVIGDFNGDGNQDLAGLTGPPVYTCKMTVALGNGQGGFTGIATKDIPNFSFNEVKSIEAGDFNSDGVADVAMIMPENDFGNLIVVYGSRQPDVWSAPAFYSVATVTQTLALGDFNRDGKLDIGYTGKNSRGVILNGGIQNIRRLPTDPDFDGDRKSDVSVFRSSNGTWYVSQSSNNSFYGATFGLSGDLIVPADYDGDEKTDVSVFRNGIWYRINSSNGSFQSTVFGTSGDLPVPADFDGDGKADISVFRPSTGEWFRLNSSNNQFVAVAFGISEDKPTLGDFDGDGKADIAVFRPSTGSWYRLNSSNGSFTAVNFGIATDLPVPADFDGDGKTDIAVYRGGNWYRLNSSDGSFYSAAFGVSSDQPVAADYDGDGKADISVFRPSDGTWYMIRSTAGFTAQSFGTNGDMPIPNAFVR